jgi:hypothetical protein
MRTVALCLNVEKYYSLLSPIALKIGFVLRFAMLKATKLCKNCPFCGEQERLRQAFAAKY